MATLGLLLSIVDGEVPNALILPLLAIPATGAALLSNTSRRYRATAATGSLLNWENGMLFLGVPLLQQLQLGGMPEQVRTVCVLEVRW